MYDLKFTVEVTCHDNEKLWNTEGGIDLSLQNWHEEFDKLWPEHSKISTICNLMGSSHQIFEL